MSSQAQQANNSSTGTRPVGNTSDGARASNLAAANTCGTSCKETGLKLLYSNSSMCRWDVLISKEIPDQDKGKYRNFVAKD